jgi:ketosteroid isomerase-like protein
MCRSRGVPAAIAIRFRRNTVDQPDNPILQVLDDYKAAVLAKDLDAFIALYDEDVRVFDMWGAWSYNGIASWRDMVARWFGSLGTERVVVDFSDPQTIVAQDLAVVHAFVTYQAVTADGVALRSLDNRLTMTLRQRGGGWKVVHEHTSSPLDVETAKVIFNR